MPNDLNAMRHMFAIKRFRLYGALTHFHLFADKINQKLMVADNVTNYGKFIRYNLCNFIS